MAVNKQNTILKTGAYMMRTIIRILLYAVAVLMIIRAATWAYGFGFSIFSDQTVDTVENGREIYVQVETGASVEETAKMLEKEGLIKDYKVFMIQEKLSEYKDQIKPGTYVLDTSMTAEEMLAILSGNNTEGQPLPGNSEDGVKTGETHHDRG